jgi:hypothetical protein
MSEDDWGPYERGFEEDDDAYLPENTEEWEREEEE